MISITAIELLCQCESTQIHTSYASVLHVVHPAMFELSWVDDFGKKGSPSQNIRHACNLCFLSCFSFLFLFCVSTCSTIVYVLFLLASPSMMLSILAIVY